MKKCNFSFTPPRSRKFNLRLIAKIALCVCLAGCGPVSAETKADESEPQISEINSFREYDWGTTLDDVKEQEIKSDMLEYRDYRLDEIDDISDLCLYNGSIDTYDANVEYMFLNGELVAGGYDLDIDDSNYEDICTGVSEKYGDPKIEKSSTGWGDCSIWIDDEKNMILVSEKMGILYFEYNTDMIDRFSVGLEKFHEIDIKKELEKFGDEYVGY